MSTCDEEALALLFLYEEPVASALIQEALASLRLVLSLVLKQVGSQ